MSGIRIYTTTYCGYCRAAKRFFDEKKLSYEEIDLTGDDDGRAALTQRTGRQTVPQIFIGDVHVGGYTDMLELQTKGKLQPLLDALPPA